MAGCSATALLVAVQLGLGDMVEVLLSYSANIDARLPSQRSAFHIAAAAGDLVVLRVLLRGSSCSIDVGTRLVSLRPLIEPVFVFEDIDSLNKIRPVDAWEEFVARGAVETKDGCKMVPVNPDGVVEMMNVVPVVEEAPPFLLEGDGVGFTPLHLACHAGHAAVVSMLNVMKVPACSGDYSIPSPLELAARAATRIRDASCCLWRGTASGVCQGAPGDVRRS